MSRCFGAQTQDTEFPGVVARPVGDFNQPDYQYQTLR